MRRVVVESPYAGDIEQHAAYARACLRDCLLRNEAPLASHLLYTQPGVLDDLVPEERVRGINAGHAWIKVAHAVVVYTDYGISIGMSQGIEAAGIMGVPVEYRELGLRMPEFDRERGIWVPNEGEAG